MMIRLYPQSDSATDSTPVFIPYILKTVGLLKDWSTETQKIQYIQIRNSCTSPLDFSVITWTIGVLFTFSSDKHGCRGNSWRSYPPQSCMYVWWKVNTHCTTHRPNDYTLWSLVAVYGTLDSEHSSEEIATLAHISTFPWPIQGFLPHPVWCRRLGINPACIQKGANLTRG